MLTNLDTIRIVVIGGGSVAERKIAGLVAAGAQPVVISPAVTPAIAAWAEAGTLTWQVRPYAEGDLAGAVLALAATNNRAVNAQVAEEARQRGVLANVGDDPEAGMWTTAATVRRGDLVIAATTSGASPALTARIRRDLEAQYGEEYATLLALLREVRAGPAQRLPPAERTALLRRLAQDDVCALVQAGDLAAFWAIVAQWTGAE